MKMRDLLIRLAGHDPKSLSERDRGDYQAVIHTGWTILPPLVVTFINWAGAGIVLSLGAGQAIAISAGLIFGAIGFLIILVFDRAALYHMDTQIGSARAKYALVGVRALIILLISSLTTQGIVPILMRPELAQVALRMREQSNNERRERLSGQYDLPGHRIGVDQANADVQAARRILAVIPPEIEKRLVDARTCWAGYRHRRSQLFTQGPAETAMRESLAAIHARCSSMGSVAQHELAAYRQKSQAILAAAEEHARDAKVSLDESETSLQTQTAEAAQIEKSAIVPQSSIVLQNLLKTNSGARQKWWTIYLAILFVEIMALFLKLVSGPSVLGTRIATNRQIATESYARRRGAAAQEFRVEDALRETMTASMLTALSSAEVQNHAFRLFATKIEALIPIHVFHALMREIEAGELDLDEAIRRHPDCAHIITEGWRKAVEEIAERLRPMRGYDQRKAA